MRFKTDENIHPDAAALLRRHGHDAVTIWDEGMRGHDDAAVAEACRHEQRALITLDLGFADVRAFPPGSHSGIIVLRSSSQGRQSVLGLLERIVALLDTEPVRGGLWIAGPDSVRVRGGDEPSR